MQFKALLIFVVSQGKIFFYLISLQKADYIESMKTCRKVGERDEKKNGQDMGCDPLVCCRNFHRNGDQVCVIKLAEKKWNKCCKNSEDETNNTIYPKFCSLKKV